MLVNQLLYCTDWNLILERLNASSAGKQVTRDCRETATQNWYSADEVVANETFKTRVSE